jgi:hypothetical protein
MSTDGNGPRGPKALLQIRKTWRAMNDWGDEFERRHFNGDWKQAVGQVSKRSVDAVQTWTAEVEQKHFDGDFLGVVQEVLSVPGLPSESSSSGFFFDEFDHDEAARRVPPSVSVVPAAAILVTEPATDAHSAAPSGTEPSASLWDEAQRLQNSLLAQRERRRQLTAQRQASESALGPLREALTKERQACREAALQREAAEERRRSAETALELMQVKHHRISSVKAFQDAEVRRLTLVIGLTEQAAREWEEGAVCQQGREWARDGPETDALKAAKLTLAELHISADEKRHKNRRELLALHDTLQTAESENRALRARHSRGGVASFGASLLQLIRTARGAGSAETPAGMDS